MDAHVREQPHDLSRGRKLPLELKPLYRHADVNGGYEPAGWSHRPARGECCLLFIVHCLSTLRRHVLYFCLCSTQVARRHDPAPICLIYFLPFQPFYWLPLLPFYWLPLLSRAFTHPYSTPPCPPPHNSWSMFPRPLSLTPTSFLTLDHPSS